MDDGVITHIKRLFEKICPEHVRVETRSIPSKDDKPGLTIYEQIAYAHLGGKLPTVRHNAITGSTHANRNDKVIWERMAKKFSKYGLQRFSMGYGAIVMGYGMIQQSINDYALCPVTVNIPYLTKTYRMMFLYTFSVGVSRNA